MALYLKSLEKNLGLIHVPKVCGNQTKRSTKYFAISLNVRNRVETYRVTSYTWPCVFGSL